jgi:hypothetical protein
MPRTLRTGTRQCVRPATEAASRPMALAVPSAVASRAAPALAAHAHRAARRCVRTRSTQPAAPLGGDPKPSTSAPSANQAQSVWDLSQEPTTSSETSVSLATRSWALDHHHVFTKPWWVPASQYNSSDGPDQGVKPAVCPHGSPVFRAACRTRPSASASSLSPRPLLMCPVTRTASPP